MRTGWHPVRHLLILTISQTTGRRSAGIFPMLMKQSRSMKEDNSSISSTLPNNKDASYVQAIDATSEKNVDLNSANATISASLTEITTGPLPHPEHLERYDKVIKNGAERIMQMAEKEQVARLERSAASVEMAKKEVAMQSRGQWFAFVLVFLFLGLATLFVFTGHETIAYVLFAVSLTPVVSVFIKGKNINHK